MTYFPNLLSYLEGVLDNSDLVHQPKRKLCFSLKPLNHVGVLKSKDVAWISKLFSALFDQPAEHRDKEFSEFSLSDSLNECGSSTAQCSGCFGWKRRRRVISGQNSKTLRLLRHFCVFPSVVVISLWSLWLLRPSIGWNVFHPWMSVWIRNVAAVKGAQYRFWANCQSENKLKDLSFLNVFYGMVLSTFFYREEKINPRYMKGSWAWRNHFLQRTSQLNTIFQILIQ